MFRRKAVFALYELSLIRKKKLLLEAKLGKYFFFLGENKAVDKNLAEHDDFIPTYLVKRGYYGQIS